MVAACEVRIATREDLVVVAALAASEREELGEEALKRHLSVYLSEGGTVLVASLEGRVLGFVMSRTAAPYLFSSEPALVLDAIYVTPDARRRGMGHALISGALTLAIEAGAPQIYATSSVADRSMQRFLARLGFAAAGGFRLVATTTLQRKLGYDDAPSSRRGDLLQRLRREPVGRASVDDLLARRRRAKEAGMPTGALDLRALQSSTEVN